MSLEAHNQLSPLPIGITTGAATMSSREIAEVVGARHDSVKRTIERLAEGGLIRFSPTVETSHDGAGARPVEVYSVNERDSYVVVARLSPEFTAKLVDFWQAHRQPARALTAAEVLFEQARMLVEVERRQTEHAGRIAETERRLDQIETATDHFTCIGYARWAKQTSIDLKDAAALGRIASKRCRELGISISKIPDPRFGAVNQFPKSILDAAWEEKFGKDAA